MKTRPIHRWVFVLGFFVFCSGSFGKCGNIYGPVGPGGMFDLSYVTGEINTAITNITSSADTWVATLSTLVSRIEGQAPQAAAYIRDTLQNGIAKVGVEYRCNADFTASRIRNGLVALVESLRAANRDVAPPVIEAKPTVCSATPDKISWKEATQVVSIYGYDFSLSKLSVILVQSNGQEKDISYAVTQQSRYQITVNLSSSGASFPQTCTKIVARWEGNKQGPLSEIPCVVDCPAPPPPIIVPADRKTVLDETQTCGDSMLTGCRFDRYVGGACPDGYLRVEPFQVTLVNGKGNGNCGEGNQNVSSNTGTHWQTSNQKDCSIHEHIGLQEGNYQGFRTCRYMVEAIRPEKVTPQPAPTVGWCQGGYSDIGRYITLEWSSAGRISGKYCVQWKESSDPNTWDDNYLCSNNDFGMKWSSAGAISGMRCTQILESSDPHTWSDNYLCVPNDSYLTLSWSSAGPISGLKCTQISEPADPHTWGDNYLCY